MDVSRKTPKYATSLTVLLVLLCPVVAAAEDSEASLKPAMCGKGKITAYDKAPGFSQGVWRAFLDLPEDAFTEKKGYVPIVRHSYESELVARMVPGHAFAPLDNPVAKAWRDKVLTHASTEYENKSALLRMAFSTDMPIVISAVDGRCGDDPSNQYVIMPLSTHFEIIACNHAERCPPLNPGVQ